MLCAITKTRDLTLTEYCVLPTKYMYSFLPVLQQISVLFPSVLLCNSLLGLYDLHRPAKLIDGDENLSHIMRKPVFGMYNQVRHKPACSATEIS